MLKVTKFASLERLNNFLQGAISADCGQGPIYGLGGKVLKLTTPAATCTFATTNNSSQEALTLLQIANQVNASAIAATVTCRVSNNLLVLVEKTPTTGLVLGSEGSGSTANHLLGFSPAGAAGKVYADPAGSNPKLVNISSDDLTSYLVTTSE